MEKDEKGETIYYDREKQIHLRSQEDGSLRARAASNLIQIDKKGNVTVNRDLIKSIGIKNIVDLKSYEMMTKDGVTTHMFEFINGRKGKLVYDELGKFHECMIGGEISVTDDGEIIISQGEPPQKE
jgi:hypothetical protein